MTRIYMSSFAYGSTTYDRMSGQNTLSSSGTGSYTIDDSAGMFAQYSMHVQSGSAGYANYNIGSVATSSFGGYLSVYTRFASLPAAETNIIFIDNASGDDNRITIDATGYVRFYSGSTLVGTTASAVTLDTVYALDVKLTTTGIGARCYNPNAESPSEFASAGTNRSWYASSVTIGPASNASGLDFRFTNIAINNTSGSYELSYPQPRRVWIAAPAGAGSSNTWQKTDGSAGDSTNYQLVDEAPPNQSDYIHRPASTLVNDYYTFPASETAGIVDTDNLVLVGVNAHHRAGSAGANVELAQFKAASGGTDLRSTAVAGIGTSWTTNIDTYYRPYPLLIAYVNPTTSAVMTGATLDAAQFGVYNSSASSTTYDVSAVWCYVEAILANSRLANLPTTGGLTVDSRIIGPGSYHADSTIIGTSEIAGAGIRTAHGAGTAEATADTTTTGERTRHADVTAGGIADTSIAVTGFLYVAGTMPGTSDLTAPATRAQYSDVEAGSVAGSTSTPRAELTSTGPEAQVAGVDAVGVRYQSSTSALTSTAAVTSDQSLKRGATVQVDGTLGMLILVGGTSQVQVTLGAASTLGADALRSGITGAGLPGIGGITPEPRVTRPANSEEPGVAGLIGAATRTAPTTTTAEQTGALLGTGIRGRHGDGPLDQLAITAGIGRLAAAGTSTAGHTATLGATATVIRHVTASVLGEADNGPGGQRSTYASGTLDALAEQTGSAWKAKIATVTIGHEFELRERGGGTAYTETCARSALTGTIRHIQRATVTLGSNPTCDDAGTVTQRHVATAGLDASAGSALKYENHPTVTLGWSTGLTCRPYPYALATATGTAGMTAQVRYGRHAEVYSRQTSDAGNTAAVLAHVEATMVGRAAATATATEFTFPATPIDISVQMEFAPGVWTEVATAARKVRGIQRDMWRTGGAGSSTTDPGGLLFSLNSFNNEFNFRNTESEFWREGGWRGVGVRAFISGHPFFAGTVSTITTEYDMDGMEYAGVSAKGILFESYSNNSEADPVDERMRAVTPALYWRLDEALGSTYYAPGIPGAPDDRLYIAGRVRGMPAAANTVQQGAIEGPCGSSRRFTDFSIDLNASSTPGTEKFDASTKCAIPNIPFAVWTAADPIPWPAGDSTLNIEFGLRVEDGRTGAPNTYYSTTDPEFYSDLDPFGGDSTYSRRGGDGTEFQQMEQVKGTIVSVLLSNGSMVTVGLAQTPGGAMDLQGSSRKCNWGSYTDWGFQVQYGKQGNPGNIIASNRYYTRQNQGLIMDLNWHHIQVQVFPDPDFIGSFCRVYIDGIQEKGATMTLSLGTPISSPSKVSLHPVDATWTQLKSVSCGYLAINPGLGWRSGVALALSGHAGEYAVDRFTRIMDAAGLPGITSGAGTTVMGAQRSWSIRETLLDVENADIGRICELPSGAVRFEALADRCLAGRPTFDLVAQDFSHAAPELGGPSSNVISALTASITGSTETFIASGYVNGATVTADANVASPVRLAAWAMWTANKISPYLDDEVHLHFNMATTPELAIRWLQAAKNPPITFRITGLRGCPEPIELVADGFSDTIPDPFEWTVVVACRPRRPYKVGWLDGSGPRELRMDIEATVANQPGTTGETLILASRSQPGLTVDPAFYPFYLRIRGERVKILAPVGHTYAMLGVGSIAYAADTGIMEPGLPPGAVAGDLLLLAIASHGGATISIPGGWIQLGQSIDPEGLRTALYGKAHTGGLGPSVELETGQPGVSQLVAIRSGAPIALAAQGQYNGSGTSPLVPLAAWGPLLGSHVTIHVTARQGDWGTVIAPARTVMLDDGADTTHEIISFAWAYGAPPEGLNRTGAFFQGAVGSGRGSSLAVAVATDCQKFSIRRGMDRSVDGDYVTEITDGDYVADLSIGDQAVLWNAPTLEL